MALRCLASRWSGAGQERRRLLKGGRVELRRGLMGSALSRGGRRGHRGGKREQSRPRGGSDVGVVLGGFMGGQGLAAGAGGAIVAGNENSPGLGAVRTLASSWRRSWSSRA